MKIVVMIFYTFPNTPPIYPKYSPKQLISDPKLDWDAIIETYKDQTKLKPSKMRQTIHRLKTIQPYFSDVIDGTKTFEVRVNDRDLKVGDLLILEEYYNPLSFKDLPDGVRIDKHGYTGRKIEVVVSYLLKLNDVIPKTHQLYSPSDVVVMSFIKVED